MRPFEILILILLAGVLAGLAVPARLRPRFWVYLPGALLAAVTLHLTLEGYRWQMMPLISLAAPTVIVAFFAMRGRTRAQRTRLRKAAGILGLAVVALLLLPSAAMPVILPVFELPTPTGPHAIGTTTLSVVDPDRPEYITSEPNDYRELLVKIWYPADPTPDATRAVYDPNAHIVGRVLAEHADLPTFWFDHLALVRSHAWQDVPVSTAQAAWPVLVFSHGYLAGTVTQNTALMEALASHGYIVASVGHTYETLAVAHDDGRVVKFDVDRKDAFACEVQTVRMQDDLFGAYLRASDDTQQARLMDTGLRAMPTVADSLKLWADDLDTIIAELARMQSGQRPGRFAGRMDLNALGVFGMSFGGTVSNEYCYRNPQVKAGLNLDGPIAGSAFHASHTMPFMHLQVADSEMPNAVSHQRASAPSYRVLVSGAKHVNFTDLSIMAPVFGRQMGVIGTIDGDTMIAIMNDYVVAFFDRYLKGMESPLLDGTVSPYAEVSLLARNLPGAA